MTPPALHAVRDTFRAVAEAVVPDLTACTAETWHALDTTVERALAARSERTRRQVAMFLRLLDLLSITRYRHRFSQLSLAQRGAVLEGLGASRFLMIRRGVWGLKTLVFLGYYTQPAVQRALGYAPHRDGWRARRVTLAPP